MASPPGSPNRALCILNMEENDDRALYQYAHVDMIMYRYIVDKHYYKLCANCIMYMGGMK